MTNKYKEIAEKIGEKRQNKKVAEQAYELFIRNKEHYYEILINNFDFFYKKINEYISEGDFLERVVSSTEAKYIYADTEVNLSIIEPTVSFAVAILNVKKEKNKILELEFDLRYADSDLEWIDNKNRVVDFEYVTKLLEENI